MLVSPQQLIDIFGVKPSPVLHVGAGFFEEVDLYSNAGYSPVIWVDCNPQTISLSKEKVQSPNKFIEALVSSEHGNTLQLNLAGPSSSVFFRPGHDEAFPHIKYQRSITLTTARLDLLLSETECPKFVNMDIEGSELDALIGMGELVEKVDIFYLEVSKPGWGLHANFRDVRRFLRNIGFREIGIFWYWDKGFGDAIYIRKSLNRNIRTKLRSRLFLANWQWRRIKNSIVLLRNRILSWKNLGS